MAPADNRLGHRANQLAQKRLQYYRGHAVIQTRNLAFESDAILGSRPLDDANIKRLLNVFKLEGCANLDPEHRVVATISEVALQRALEQTGIAQANLFDYGSAPNLEFADTVRLVCAYGKHRIRAGEAFGEDRWLVELYLSDIPPDALAQLREESSNAQDFKDGEIYQILRRYHLLGNMAQEQKWWARFRTEDRRKQFRRLQQNRLLCEGFDNLLHYIGLWDPLKAYHIERILGLRCHEYIFHYLSEIHNTWSYLFPDNTGYMVDPSSVRLVEGLMPSYSSEDSNTIMKLIDQEICFPCVQGDSERATLKNRLLDVPGRLLSIRTLVQDTLYLQRPAKIFRSLLPPRFKGTVREAMLRCWNSQNMDMTCGLQASEHVFKPLPSLASPFIVSMTQLWLFSLRHFVKPHADTTCRRRMASWSTETHSLNSMATLAWKLGFSSAEINALRKEDIDSTDTDHMLRVFCVDGFYHIDEGKLRSMTHRLKECWRNLKRIKETQRGVPRFVTDDARTMTRRRYNCPLEDEHQQDRSYLFVENVFSADQSCALYPTSFAVTREIIFAFFGKSPLYDVFALPSSTSSEERLHQCENHTDIMQTEQQEDEAVNERSPVELLPHPPGTPDRDRMRSHSLLPDNSLNLPDEPSGPPSHTPVDIDFSLSSTFTDYMDGVEQDVPLAAGFENHISKAPLEKKAVVSLHRKVTDILRLWYESENTTLVVLFLFESRAYYKFLIQSELALRSTLRDLGRDHYFLIIDDYGIKAPDMKDINEAALREHLVLVGRKCGPGQGFEEQDGQISVDNLRDYAIKFDVRTGKRKAAESPSMSAKRRAYHY